MRNPRTRIEDMLRAIANIEQHTQGGLAAFERDEVLQIYMVHHLVIIGEAVARLPRDFVAIHPEIPWDSIRGMRNILVHDYFRVDTTVVWQVIENNLPTLKGQLTDLLDEPVV